MLTRILFSRSPVPILAYLLSSYYTFVAASEVSSILESRISGANTGGDVQETGRVLSELIVHLIWGLS